MLKQTWEAKIGWKVHLNQVSNSQPPGLKSNTLTTEPPPGGAHLIKG